MGNKKVGKFYLPTLARWLSSNLYRSRKTLGFCRKGVKPPFPPDPRETPCLRGFGHFDDFPQSHGYLPRLNLSNSKGGSYLAADNEHQRQIR